MRPFASVLLLSLLLVACNRHHVAKFSYRSTPVDGWESADTLIFPIDSLPADGRYALTIGVRTFSGAILHMVSFDRPMSTNSLSLDYVIGPEARFLSQARYADTIYCSLTDHEGDVSGKGVSVYQYSFPVDTFQLHRGARGTITIHHIMRRNLLPGVSDVGIRLERL